MQERRRYFNMEDKKEYIQMYFDIFKEAKSEYYDKYKHTYQIPNSIYYLAQQFPEGREKYLKQERFEYIKQLRSNMMAEIWICDFNCGDVDCVEFCDAVTDKLLYFHNLKERHEDVAENFRLSNIAKEDLKSFFIGYFRIRTIDKWINNTKPKSLPTILLNNSSRFDSVERLLISNGWLDPTYRWVRQDSNKELHYLLFILAKHEYFNGITKTKRGDLTNENKYNVLLSPLLDRWQFDNKVIFIRDYLKHSKFITATPPQVDKSGTTETFAFLNLKPK